MIRGARNTGRPKHEEYYTSRKAELLERFNEDARYWSQVIASLYGGDFAETIVRETVE